MRSMNLRPLSSSCFFNKIIAHEYVHHETTREFCPYCYRLQLLQNSLGPPPQNCTYNILVEEEVSQMSLVQLEAHKNCANIQKEEYSNQIKHIQNRTLRNTVLVVQDFTQLEGDSTFYQDLIFSVTGVAGNYYHHNFHYVAAASNGKVPL
jgi:hypothetical protein